MSAQACNPGSTKQNASASTIWLMGCQFTGPNFCFYPHPHSVPFITSLRCWSAPCSRGEEGCRGKRRCPDTQAPPPAAVSHRISPVFPTSLTLAHAASSARKFFPTLNSCSREKVQMAQRVRPFFLLCILLC